MAKGNLGEGVVGLLVPGLARFDRDIVEFIPSNRVMEGGYSPNPMAADRIMREGCYIVECPERGRLIVPLTLGVLVYGKKGGSKLHFK
ncbi:MAG: hypothetical protein PVI21_06030 [Candidatus Woesebacteria bacterium]|jgi:hypothetical protein